MFQTLWRIWSCRHSNIDRRTSLYDVFADFTLWRIWSWRHSNIDRRTSLYDVRIGPWRHFTVWCTVAKKQQWHMGHNFFHGAVRCRGRLSHLKQAWISWFRMIIRINMARMISGWFSNASRAQLGIRMTPGWQQCGIIQDNTMMSTGWHHTHSG